MGKSDALTVRRSPLARDMRRDYQLYLMLLPAVVLFLIFSYMPMTGLVIAFKNYRIGQGMYGINEWVGWSHFIKLSKDLFFRRAFMNTMIIAFLRIAVCLPGAVMLALLLFEVKGRVFKGAIQTLVYIPRFLSWVIVASFAITMLNPEQGINMLLRSAGFPAVALSNPSQFRSIVVLSDLWKDVGFNSVLFTAAIMTIDPALYESAMMDGANRYQKILHITLPMIRNTIIIVLVLWVGSIVNVGFDQVFNMYNPSVQPTGDIIDTYIYRIAFTGSAQKFSFAAAAGLFKSAIAIVLLAGAELFARSIGESALF
jgi:putative aldouronate transport system permease protein